MISQAAVAATFTVDSTADKVDAKPGDGTCATDVGSCTLRAAVQAANEGGGGTISRSRHVRWRSSRMVP
jgi:CSLREA domain-containing protein